MTLRPPPFVRAPRLASVDSITIDLLSPVQAERAAQAPPLAGLGARGIRALAEDVPPALDVRL